MRALRQPRPVIGVISEVRCLIAVYHWRMPGHLAESTVSCLDLRPCLYHVQRINDFGRLCGGLMGEHDVMTGWVGLKA
jgi:hypothetical protein